MFSKLEEWTLSVSLCPYPLRFAAEPSSPAKALQSMSTGKSALSIDFAHSSTNSIYGTLSSPYRRIRPTGKREHLLIILDVLRSVLVGMDKPPTLVLDNISALFSAFYEPVGSELVRIEDC